MSCFALLGLWFKADGQDNIELRAADAALSAPFILTNGCLLQLTETGLTNGGRAAFSFTITAGGPHTVAVLLEAPATNHNSMLISIDSEPNDSTALWAIPPHSGFATNLVCNAVPVVRTRVFNLSAGMHQLIMRGCSPNIRLARIWVQNARPAPPTGLRIIAQ